MNKQLTTEEEKLLKSYKEDFLEKTGKKVEFNVLDKWKSLCLLDKSVTPDDLMQLIFDVTGWDQSIFSLNNKNKKAVVSKRQVVYYILRNNKISFKDITRLSGKDHSNIINNLKSFESDLATDPYTGILLKEIVESINTVI